MNSAIIITGVSALQFWLYYSNNKYFERVSLPKNINVLNSAASAKLAATALGLSLPLCIAVPQDSCRHATKTVHYTNIGKHLPAYSIVCLKHAGNNMDIYIASPEYCFLMFAAKLPLHLLIELGNNLCASYAYDPKAELKQSFREPVTNSLSIKQYVSAATNNPGFRMAERAAKYLCDGSNSPMETKLAVMLVLPLFEGGYNLTGFEMNKKIILSRAAIESLGTESCCCDIVWGTECVVIEYDSNLTHLEVNQHQYDNAKSNALTNTGYITFRFTSQDIKTFRSLESSFGLVRQALKRPSRNDRLQKYTDKRRKVFYDLFKSGDQVFNLRVL
ncbi:MAG: hypothetical protein IKH67_00725 [Lachnospiraceae bacterium]|nr:hypothetical protein [Lachnospiraceae bacterium]